ncbi:MAG: hypothetical protein HY812_20505 [Planctomycetes bacterium]|nr:hypothetical protein [Planctomycetota bacterium]
MNRPILTTLIALSLLTVAYITLVVLTPDRPPLDSSGATSPSHAPVSHDERLAAVPDPAEPDVRVPVETAQLDDEPQPLPDCGHAEELASLYADNARLQDEVAELHKLLADVLLDPRLAVSLPLATRYVIEARSRGLPPSDAVENFLEDIEAGAQEAGCEEALTSLTFDYLERQVRPVLEKYDPLVDAARERHRKEDDNRPLRPDGSHITTAASEAAYEELLRIKEERRLQVSSVLPAGLSGVFE